MKKLLATIFIISSVILHASEDSILVENKTYGNKISISCLDQNCTDFIFKEDNIDLSRKLNVDSLEVKKQLLSNLQSKKNRHKRDVKESWEDFWRPFESYDEKDEMDYKTANRKWKEGHYGESIFIGTGRSIGLFIIRPVMLAFGFTFALPVTASILIGDYPNELSDISANKAQIRTLKRLFRAQEKNKVLKVRDRLYQKIKSHLEKI